MFNVKPKARAFNAGQFSYMMVGRSDHQKYPYGCKYIRNMLTRPQGPAFCAPGTKLIWPVYDESKKGRMIPFIFSEDDKYAIEFSEGVIRFFTKDGVVLSSGSPYTLESPYQEADLPYIQHDQTNDVMYLSCRGYKPMVLKRFGHTNWTLTTNTYDDGPFLDQNTDEDVKLTVASIVAGATGVAITATGGDVFESGHVDALFKIKHPRPAVLKEGVFASVTQSDGFYVYGDWELVTHDNWGGTLVIQKSYDKGTTWQNYKIYTSKIDGNGAGDYNAGATGEETENNIMYRIAMTAFSSGSCTWKFTIGEKVVSGVVRITAVTDARNAVCAIIEPPYATTATWRWCEGAWSDVNGYPRAVNLCKGRLWFGGTTKYPTVVDVSRAGNYNLMEEGTDADDAIRKDLNDARQDPILWLADIGSVIIAGTAGSEHALDKINKNDPFGPDNLDSDRQSKIGSKSILPIVCSDALLYASSDGKKVYEMAYTYETENWASNDLTIMSEDITGTGIVRMACQTRPNIWVWCCLADGNLAVMNYERKEQVVGWVSRTTNGQFEDVCVVPDQPEDQVWFMTKRTINGQTRRFIELMAPINVTEQKDMYFVDCGLTFDGGSPVSISDVSVDSDTGKVTLTVTGHSWVNGNTIRITGIEGTTWLNNKIFMVADSETSTVCIKLKDGSAYIDGREFDAYISGGSAVRVASVLSGFDHLEGQTVQILGDGSPIADQVVSDGQITIPDGRESVVVHAGLGYRKAIVPMPFEVPTDTGTSPAYKQRIYALLLHFYKSLGCKVGPSESNLDDVEFITVGSETDQAPPLFTGMKNIPFSGDYLELGEIWIVQDLPLPMTIISIEPKMGVAT